MNDLFDIVIIGGGIAGLYSGFRLLQQNPDTRLLIVEKQSYLGGRIFTYHDDTMTVEGGAGRFSKHHAILWKLLNELGLSSKISPISGGFEFVSSNRNFPERRPKGDENGVAEEGSQKAVSEVVLASKRESLSYLRSVSFLDFAKGVVGVKRANHIVDSFGYYSELVIMNAHDAIVLMDVLDTPDFYSLVGGLSQIITELEKRIRSYPNVQIRLKTNVSHFVLPKHPCVKTRGCLSDKFRFSDETTEGSLSGKSRKGQTRKMRNAVLKEHPYCITLDDDTRVYSRKCIFAVPKQALEKLSAFRPVRPLLKYIVCGSLCRIYSQFPTDSTIDKLYDQKITTNNDLRMIIPVDAKRGVVMISYSDNKFADGWHAMEKSKDGIKAIDAKIADLVNETLDIRIPKPLKTKVFYWPCGVGYWKVGANSRDISKRIIRPFAKHDVFVCGEHYSEKNQQWMEGALETSEKVFDILRRDTRRKISV